MIQLEGSIKLGADSVTAVDYSAEISSLKILRSRAMVTVPPTFANAREEQSAGALSERLEINFFNSHLAASFHREAYDAIDTDTAELYWEGTLQLGAISADNPKYSGTIVITAIDTGGDVTAFQQQRQTYPIIGGITRDVTPA